MTKIYADMAMVDTRIAQNYSVRRSADTMRVYGAILEKYGYTEQDFMVSQEKYVNDAGRYVKMLKNSVLALEKERKLLQAEQKRIEELKAMAEGVLRHAPNRIYLMDTLDLADTSWFDFDFQQGLDTAFCGPMLIVWADTTGSVSQVDSLKTEEPEPAEVELVEKVEAVQKAKQESAFGKLLRNGDRQKIEKEIVKADVAL